LRVTREDSPTGLVLPKVGLTARLRAGGHARVSVGGEPADGVVQRLRGSVCGSPSSRTAFVGEKYMRLRAMRTAVRGTAGGGP